MHEKKPPILRSRQAGNPDASDVFLKRESESLIAIGRVVKAHGLRGQLKVIPLTDNIERYKALRSVILEFPEREARYEVEKVKIQDAFVILKIAGVDNRTQAEEFHGAWVSVEKKDMSPLDEDRFYVFDLLGVEAYDVEGKKIGVVVRVEDYPANAVLVVESDTEEIWIPALKNVVTALDLNEKRMTVRIPEGLPTYPKRGG